METRRSFPFWKALLEFGRAVIIWNLGTHEPGYDFTIFFIYMNSFVNWIHDHEILHEFII